MDNSLNFLQECINKVNNATPEEIEKYKKAYEDLEIMTDTISMPKQANTEMKIGGLTIYIDKKFNRFQKKMLKWCFGFDEINDVVR